MEQFVDSVLLRLDSAGFKSSQLAMIRNIIKEIGDLVKNGATMDEMDAYLTELCAHTATYFVVDDLTYLYRGGRVTGVSKVIGNLLGIKPILYFNEEGYYIGTDFLDRDYAEVWVNEDGLREYYSFTGYMWADEESSEPTSRYTRDVTYEYTYSDGKVKTRKARETNYNEEDGYSDSFSIGVITARKWSRIKVNENTLRSARCAATVIKRVWDEGEMSLEVPGEFVYEWK
jgi:hypothetical protein